MPGFSLEAEPGQDDSSVHLCLILSSPREEVSAFAFVWPWQGTEQMIV